MRIKCEAEFITSEDSQKAAFAAMPMLQKMGYAVGDGFFEIYTIKNPEISFTSMVGKKLDGIEL